MPFSISGLLVTHSLYPHRSASSSVALTISLQCPGFLCLLLFSELSFLSTLHSCRVHNTILNSSSVTPSKWAVTSRNNLLLGSRSNELRTKAPFIPCTGSWGATDVRGDLWVTGHGISLPPEPLWISHSFPPSHLCWLLQPSTCDSAPLTSALRQKIRKAVCSRSAGNPALRCTEWAYDWIPHLQV